MSFHRCFVQSVLMRDLKGAEYEEVEELKFSSTSCFRCFFLRLINSFCKCFFPSFIKIIRTFLQTPILNFFYTYLTDINTRRTDKYTGDVGAKKERR